MVDDGESNEGVMEVEAEPAAPAEAREEEREDEAPPTPPHPMMIITDQERGWALALKEAVAANPDLANLSDMDYAYHAIATRGDSEMALQQIQGMQVFREQYKVGPLVSRYDSKR